MDYSTIAECINQSQKPAKSITIDGGAASKFYHVIWNNPEEFKNVIIHLGDFHGLQEFFCVIGKNEDALTAAKAVESKDDCDILFATESFVDYETKYKKRMAECLNRIHGKTAQFWMDYVQSVDRQHRLHYAINTNNVDERLQCWKDSVKLCFATNKQNYSRYGSYYCLQLDNIEETHPGAKEELEIKG